MPSRRATCRAQVLESRSEELLYNKLILLEHELNKYVHDIARKIRDISDPRSIREIVKLVDIELTREEDVDRYRKVIATETRVELDMEPIQECDCKRIDNESEIVEEYYIGQKILEKLLISSW